MDTYSPIEYEYIMDTLQFDGIEELMVSNRYNLMIKTQSNDSLTPHFVSYRLEQRRLELH